MAVGATELAGRPQSALLQEAVEEYLEWLEFDRHTSRGTVAGYRGELVRFRQFADSHGAAGVVIGRVDRDLVRAYQHAVARAATGPAGDRRPLAPATRKRRLIALRSFLRFCQRERWLREDLASTIDLPKLAQRLPKPLEDGHRDRLVVSLTASSPRRRRDRALFLLLLCSGARISEVLALDRSDWGVDVIVRGKGDRERPLLITTRARAAVEDYLVARTDRSHALFIGFQPANRHTRLTPTGARHICRQLAQDLGIPRFHPHQLRHTLATMLQGTIGDARLTAETLGHVGLASVAGYTRLTDGRRRQARDQVELAGI